MLKQIALSLGLVVGSLIISSPNPYEFMVNFTEPMNFTTVADNEHYDWLPGLIASIRRCNPRKTINILVFDIGLEPNQVQELRQRYKVEVCRIEQTHPDLTKKFVVRPNGRKARGWYAWKPVAFHQALEKFEYFLHVDAGKRIVSRCDALFAAIKQDGYFFFDCGHLIRPMTTNYVVNKFHLNTAEFCWILDEFGLEAGFQGISKKILSDYIEPMYQLAHDLRNFEDDGTAPWGFGGSRHDQTLFSIIARMNNFTVHKADGTGPTSIRINDTLVPFKPGYYVTFKEFNENPRAQEYQLI